MSYVTILWSMAAAAALLLAVVHASVWATDRQARANLAFAVAALGAVGIAATELGSMYAQTPQAWGEWVRWYHLPLFIHVSAIVAFVHLYLGTGRSWLAWSVIATRGLILLLNFATSPNFNFERIESVGHMMFLGEGVTVVLEATTRSWQWLGALASVLLTIYVVDAAIALWRRGRPGDKRKAAVVGGAVVTFLGLATVYSQLVLWRIVELPLLIAPLFLITLFAMAFELTGDVLRAARLMRDLRESERRLELAASAAEMGLWSWDARGNELWATDQIRSIFGFAKEEALDPLRVAARLHAEDIEAARAATLQAMASGADCAFECRVVRPDGEVRWIAMRGRPEAKGGNAPVFMRGVVRDITDLRRAETESNQLRRELAHAGRVTMLGQLSSSLAHELSQPLGAILRNVEVAQMLLDSPAPDLEELKAIVVDIHRDDRRAGDVIDRLRALLKRRDLDFQPVVIESLVQDVSSLVRADAATRHVALACSVTFHLPAVRGDRVHLSQVLLNLIMNGMDAVAERGGPRREVTVEAYANGSSTVEVAVSDSGTGIPAESLTKIFDPFFTTKSGGMGMGLSVSRTIVEAHGGRLWAENVPTGGARFRLTLPIA